MTEGQAVVVDGVKCQTITTNKMEECLKTREENSAKSVLPNEENPSLVAEENGKTIEATSSEEKSEVERVQLATQTWPSRGWGNRNMVEAVESQQPQEERKRYKAYKMLFGAPFVHSLTLIERRLEKRRQDARGRGWSPSACIFKFPSSLVGIDEKAQIPEIASIGPYHRGRDHLLEFEDYKWSFLDKFLSRNRDWGRDLSFYLHQMAALEKRTRECYSDDVLMSSHDFVEMMLVDGCYVVEFLRHLGGSEDLINENDPIFTRPWLIPVLIRDLLKLENQLPFFLLESLFINSSSKEPEKLISLALQLFNLAWSRMRPAASVSPSELLKGKHLLDIYHLSLLPNAPERERYRPSAQSMQCVTQLRPSGIKFKGTEADSFLDINFRNRVLEIPSITINDFTSTVLTNCVALEQCREDSSRYFTDYVSFMNCLISHPRDVAFLCSDGIITNFSRDDQYFASLFNALGKNVIFDIRDCYLSKQFREVEAYYSSNWATMMRTYFSSPWSVISVFSAFVLLALTMVQTIMSVLSYKCRFD